MKELFNGFQKTMKRNIEDNCLADQLKDSDYIYITMWKESGVFKLYANDIVTAESTNKHAIHIEGHRIKKILNKQSNVKVRTNLH